MIQGECDMKKQTIGIFSVISVSLLLFFQNCGKFETVSLEDELKLSSVNTFSDTARRLLGLTCTSNTVIACEINGQQGYKYCEGGKFSECRGQTIVDGNFDNNMGMQPPIKFTCQGNWTMPGTTCRNKADEYGNYIVGTSTQLYDRYGTNCGYSCECVETDPTDRSKVNWACTKDGNITIPGVKGIIGYVPTKLLNEIPLTAITEQRPNPTNSNVLIPVSNRQHNSLNPLRYVEVMQSGSNQAYRLLFSPIPVECFIVSGKCTITDKFEYNGSKYVFVQYKSNPAEMLAELKRAMNLFIPDFEVNFVIKNAFNTQATDSQIRVRMSRSGGGKFKFTQAKSFYDGQVIPDNDQHFNIFREIGFSSIASLSSDQNTFLSDSDYKLALDKTNAFLYPKSDKDLEQNYFLTKAVKLYSLSSVTNALLFKFEGNLISTTLIASRQDESFNIDEKATTIDVSKTNTTCSLERDINADPNNPKFVKYMYNVLPACSDWYMFLYGDGKAATISTATKALENFNAYTFRVGYKVNDFYLNPNVTRKYLAISSYLMLVEQRADVAWPSLNVPKLGGGRNMTENNMILRESLGIHPVEMFYNTYVGAELNNTISASVASWNMTCLTDNWLLHNVQSQYLDIKYIDRLLERNTKCSYMMYKTARALKYPGVKWSELIYTGSEPVIKVHPDNDLNRSLSVPREDASSMISQDVGIYIIRLPLVKKILITQKSPWIVNGIFQVSDTDQGIINTESAPDYSRLLSANKDNYLRLFYVPSVGAPNYYGIDNRFFDDLDYDGDFANAGVNEANNRLNYATHSVLCTSQTGRFCPAMGITAFIRPCTPIPSLDVNNQFVFNSCSYNSSYVHDDIFRIMHLDFNIPNSPNAIDLKNRFFTDFPYLDRNLLDRNGMTKECNGIADCFSKIEILWYSVLMTLKEYQVHPWVRVNRIIWQYELDNSIKSAHKITMYYRGFEPRPIDNTMTEDPIPYTQIVGPGFSINPPN